MVNSDFAIFNPHKFSLNCEFTVEANGNTFKYRKVEAPLLWCLVLDGVIRPVEEN